MLAWGSPSRFLNPIFLRWWIAIASRRRSQEGYGVNTWSWKIRLCLLVLASALGLLIWWAVALRGFGTVVLATGQQGGTYTAIGDGLVSHLGKSEARFGMETKSSRGTPQNLELLRKQEADFAIVQSGQSRSDDVRVVAKLYSEVLHILVPRESSLTSLVGLSGKRVFLGGPGSGTREVSVPILSHFGVSDYDEVGQSPQEALQQLRAGAVDAVFLVTALQSEFLREAVRGGELRFLSLGLSQKGLIARFPFLRETSIPAQTYQCPSSETGAMPQAPVATLGVPSLLVCRSGMPAELVFEVTRVLRESEQALRACS